VTELPPAQEGRRPRDLDWKRATALLYGYWGSRKLYAIGLAFIASGFSSLPILLAVCLLCAAVAYGYLVVCKYLPAGGSVYSTTREGSRLLGSVGAFLLSAAYPAIAALSCWSALSYITSGTSYITSGTEDIIWIKFLRDHIALTTIGVLFVMGLINYLGPKHSGSFAVAVALPTVVVVVLLIALSAPYLTTHFLEPRHETLGLVWLQFVGVIIAVGGVEAVGNITGVMKVDNDNDSRSENPKVTRTAIKAIIPVAIEVVLGTALLGWAMLSLPSVLGKTPHLTNRDNMATVLQQRSEDMLRFIGEQFATATFSPAVGQIFGWIVGIVFFLLLLSAANTAIVAMIDLLYLLGQDGEAPHQLTHLNRHGVPWIPLIVAVTVPMLILSIFRDSNRLAGLYPIGFIGAIVVNLASCALNRNLALKSYERVAISMISFILLAVGLTLAKTKPEGLFFALCVLGAGLGLRAYSHKLSGLRTLTVTQDLADLVSKGPHTLYQVQPTEGDPELSTEIAITTQTENFIFVCYKRENMSQIKPILLSLCASGCEVWYDKGIPGALEWDAAIEERIKNCKLFLLFLSQPSVDSKYVRREIRFADFCDKPILSVKLEQVTLAHGLYMLLQQYQMLDATAGDFSSEIRRALRFHGLVR
jgi:amino acid transporter